MYVLLERVWNGVAYMDNLEICSYGFSIGHILFQIYFFSLLLIQNALIFITPTFCVSGTSGLVNWTWIGYNYIEYDLFGEIHLNWVTVTVSVATWYRIPYT